VVEPSDWSLALAVIIGTALVCAAAPLSRTIALRLPRAIRGLSGFAVPPLLVWATFSVWGSIRGSHDSMGVLIAAWITSIVMGVLWAWLPLKSNEPRA